MRLRSRAGHNSSNTAQPGSPWLLLSRLLCRCRDAPPCEPALFPAESLYNSAASAWRGFEKCVFSLSPPFLFFFFLSHSPSIQERAKVDAERKELEQLRALYHESKSHLDKCPESMREQLREQMRRVSVSPHPSRTMAHLPPLQLRPALPRQPGPHWERHTWAGGGWRRAPLSW